MKESVLSSATNSLSILSLVGVYDELGEDVNVTGSLLIDSGLAEEVMLTERLTLVVDVLGLFTTTTSSSDSSLSSSCSPFIASGFFAMTGISSSADSALACFVLVGDESIWLSKEVSLTSKETSSSTLSRSYFGCFLSVDGFFVDDFETEKKSRLLLTLFVELNDGVLLALELKTFFGFFVGPMKSSKMSSKFASTFFLVAAATVELGLKKLFIGAVFLTFFFFLECESSTSSSSSLE